MGKPCTIAKGWTTTTSSGGTWASTGTSTGTSIGTSTGTSTTSTTSTTSCTTSCANEFKNCHNWFKGRFGCSRAYTACRDNLNRGNMARGGCTKKCKDTKTMTALKSKC